MKIYVLTTESNKKKKEKPRSDLYIIYNVLGGA